MNLKNLNFWKLPLITSVLAIGLTQMAASPAGAAPKKKDAHKKGDKIEAVLVLTRHGVRSPLKDIATMNKKTSNTWPAWNVQPGFLTPRGRKVVVGMGSYYRERFLKEGLLTGNDVEDSKRTYIHANTIQRTIQTACALGEGLFPSTTTTVHYLVGKKDMLYHGGPIDPIMKNAAVNGRVGNDSDSLAKAYKPQLDLMEKTLGQPGMFARKLSSVFLAAGYADSFMLEYCEGMPMDQVAFGKASKADLLEMYKLLALDFDLQVRTPYLARTRTSNLLSHIATTLNAVATGKRLDGAFGDADDNLFIISGHDTTLSSIAGLLHLDWVLPDTGRNLCPPGGAIVFELHSKNVKKTGKTKHYVRVYYAAETLDQIREFAKLSLKNPPAIAPIFVPGASGKSKNMDAPLTAFLKVTDQAIDPKLVYPIDDGEMH